MRYLLFILFFFCLSTLVSAQHTNNRSQVRLVYGMGYEYSHPVYPNGQSMIFNNAYGAIYREARVFAIYYDKHMNVIDTCYRYFYSSSHTESNFSNCYDDTIHIRIKYISYAPAGGSVSVLPSKHHPSSVIYNISDTALFDSVTVERFYTINNDFKKTGKQFSKFRIDSLFMKSKNNPVEKYYVDITRLYDAGVSANYIDKTRFYQTVNTLDMIKRQTLSAYYCPGDSISLIHSISNGYSGHVYFKINNDAQWYKVDDSLVWYRNTYLESKVGNAIRYKDSSRFAYQNNFFNYRFKLDTLLTHEYGSKEYKRVKYMFGLKDCDPGAEPFFSNDSMYIYMVKPLASIPYTKNMCFGDVNGGKLFLDIPNRDGGYRFLWHSKYLLGGVWYDKLNVQAFTNLGYVLYKDAVNNDTYEALCSSQYKTGTMPVNKKDTISGLLEGDYKILIFPKVPDSITDYCSSCIDTISFEFTIKSTPYIQPLGADRILCKDSTVTLSIPAAYTINGNTATWGTAYCGVNTAVSNKPYQRTVIAKGGGYHTVQINTVEGCVIRDTVIVADMQPVTKEYILPTALATNAVQYSSGWGIQAGAMKWQSKEQMHDFMTSNIYFNGRSGVFRPNKSHDYNDTLNTSFNLFASYSNTSPSTQLKEANIRNTGNIVSYKYFNYGNPLFTDCVPQWVLNNTMTKYSPSGFDIEARDILDMHTSALYGYNDQLPIAVSSNAELGEIGFEGFEEYSNENSSPNYFNTRTQLNNSTGNIDIIRQSESGFFDKTREYDVVRAFNRYVMIKGNICSACDESFVCDVTAQSVPYDLATEKIKDISVTSYNTRIMPSPCGNPEYYILQLDENLPSDETAFRCKFWTGKVSVKARSYMPVLGTYNLILDSDIAHTGRYSVRFPDDQRVIIPQSDLILKPQKTYHISAWMHKPAMLNESPETLRYTNQADSIGILVILPNNEKVFFTPQGEVVEGWQKLEGTFTMPQGMRTEIKLGFVGKSTYNVDDVRIYPQNSAIQTYIYHPDTYKVRAVLDANNYATMYQYDDEGNLFAIKKETVKGIKTIQVSSSHLKSTRP